MNIKIIIPTSVDNEIALPFISSSGSLFRGIASSDLGGSLKYHLAGLSKQAATSEWRQIALKINTAYLHPYVYIKKLISRGMYIDPSPVIDMPTPTALPLFSLKNEFIANVNACMIAATPIAEIKSNIRDNNVMKSKHMNLIK